MTLVPNDLPAADLISQIAILGAAINRHVAGGLSDAGYAELRPGHGYVVQRLLTGPQQITAMAADLGISQQAVSKTVRDLVRLGFVSQTIDDGDSRRRPVALTERGRAAVERARSIRADLERNLGAAVGTADLAATRTVIAVLLGELGLTDHVAGRTVPPPFEE
jgi:DNA-binding MarR family transcriptional regulator